MIARGLLASLALSLAACAGLGGEPTLNDAQQTVAALKFAGSGTASDLAVAGAVDRHDARYNSGDTIVLTVTVNRPASVAVLRVLHSGETAIVFPSKAHPDAHVTGTVQFETQAGKGGVELFEYIAATDGSAWLFTRKPEGSAPYVDLGPTTRALAADIATTFRGAKHGTAAVAHQAIRVRD